MSAERKDRTMPDQPQLTEQQEQAIRDAANDRSGGDFDPLRTVFPQVFTDPAEVETVTWRQGDDPAELMRVAKLPGATVHATYDDGSYKGGPVTESGHNWIGSLRVHIFLGEVQTVTVTAPRPVPPWHPTRWNPETHPVVEWGNGSRIVMRPGLTEAYAYWRGKWDEDQPTDWRCGSIEWQGETK